VQRWGWEVLDNLPVAQILPQEVTGFLHMWKNITGGKLLELEDEVNTAVTASTSFEQAWKWNWNWSFAA
jgi:hypothetical protein